MGIFGVCVMEALIGSRDMKSDEHGEHVLLFLCYALVSSNAKCVHQDLCLRRLQLVRFGYPDFKKHNRTKILAPNKQTLPKKYIIGPFILYCVILSQIETFSERCVFCVNFLEPKNGPMLIFSCLTGRTIP